MREQRRLLYTISEQEGMLSELDFYLNVRTFRAMEAWDLNDPRILTIKFEDLIENPRGILTGCFSDFLGLEAEGITPEWMKVNLAEDPFRKRSEGRSRGQEDIFHHYRKGIAGDWKNHLTPLVLEELERRWGHLLDKYEYREEFN
jgi:lipopolysaccharide transport system ATP-binding protein